MTTEQTGSLEAEEPSALRLYPIAALELTEDAIVEIERFVGIVAQQDKTKCHRYLCMLLGHIEHAREEPRQIERGCAYEQRSWMKP